MDHSATRGSHQQAIPDRRSGYRRSRLRQLWVGWRAWCAVLGLALLATPVSSPVSSQDFEPKPICVDVLACPDTTNEYCGEISIKWERVVAIIEGHEVEVGGPGSLTIHCYKGT